MKNLKKDLEYYLKLNWTYRFEWSDEDNGYVASVAELKGCMSFGETIEEAAEMIRDALKSYISCALEYNDKIPEPVKKECFKGRIAVRISPDIHYRIAKHAKAIGTSINSFIAETLTEKLNEIKSV